MRRMLCLAAILAAILALTAVCAAEGGASEGSEDAMRMNVQIGEYRFTATLEDNPATGELTEMLRQGPLTIEMDDYAGFEKVGALGTRLSASDAQTTTAPGDIVLYNSSNIVMFYGANSWAYTRLGHIDELSDWEAALGDGSITAVFTLEEPNGDEKP